MNMNRHSIEALSAAIDDEANELDLQHVLNNLDNTSSHYREKALRYQKIGDIMRKKHSAIANIDVDVSGHVMEQLLTEKKQTQHPKKQSHRLSLISKGAVAASFVTAILVGLNGYDYSLSLNANSAPETPYAKTLSQSLPKSHTTAKDPEFRVSSTAPSDTSRLDTYNQRLDEYMKIHNNTLLYDITEKAFPLVQVIHFGQK